MLKHIVMWKLKDHAEGADRAANAIEMKRRLDECASIVPGQVKFEVVIAQPGLEATYDVVLYSEFDDKAALDKFISAQKLEFAEDKDGDPVYLAQSAWWLGRAQRDNPKIEFLSTKERH